MSILEIILYSVIGIATIIWVTIVVVKWVKKRKKKIIRGGMRYGNDPKIEDYEDED